MRREMLGGALLGLVVLMAYAWSGHLWTDVVDEGYFLDLADRVRSGALPYRDFATYYTPGIFYLFAAVMSRVECAPCSSNDVRRMVCGSTKPASALKTST